MSPLKYDTGETSRDTRDAIRTSASTRLRYVYPHHRGECDYPGDTDERAWWCGQMALSRGSINVTGVNEVFT